jgi:hypothetical protein
LMQWSWRSHAQCEQVRQTGLIASMRKKRLTNGKRKRKRNYERCTWSSHTQCEWVRRKGWAKPSTSAAPGTKYKL